MKYMAKGRWSGPYTIRRAPPSMVTPRTIKVESDATKKIRAANPKLGSRYGEGGETGVGKTVAKARNAIGMIDADANASLGQI